MIDPVVSIIIPVGPSHREHVRTAIESCRWQTFAAWEAIVVNDTAEPLQLPADDRLIELSTGGGRRTAAARNLGTAAASAPFVVYLDADDYLLPGALEHLLRGHAEHEAAYTYADHYGLKTSGEWWQCRAGEYVQLDYERFNLHPISALIPTAAVRAVGGFDEGARGWEDWTLFLRLAIAGYCGQRTRGAVFVYRYDYGTNHVADNAQGNELLEEIRERYRINGSMHFMGCGCGGAAAGAKQTARIVATALPEIAMDPNQILLEFVGEAQGATTYRHPQSGNTYRAGRNASVRILDVTQAPQDVEYLLGLGLFKRVAPPPPFVDPPVAAEPEIVFSASPVLEQEIAEDDAEPVHAEPEAPAVPRKARSGRKVRA